MKNDSIKKLRLVLIAGVTSVVLLGASAAYAGEITGNGKDIDVKGKSECAFSGREDTPGETFPDGVTRVFKGLIAQSWGQLTAEAKEFFLSIGAQPGDACNPNKSGG